MIDTTYDLIGPLLDKIEELQKSTDMLKNDLNAITAATYDLHHAVAKERKSPRIPHKNARIARFMNSFIIQGYKIDEAIIKTADELNETPERVRAVYDFNRNIEQIIRKRALLMLVYILYKAGYNAKRISNLAGYSEKYIYSLLNDLKKSSLKIN